MSRSPNDAVLLLSFCGTRRANATATDLANAGLAQHFTALIFPEDKCSAQPGMFYQTRDMSALSDIACCVRFTSGKPGFLHDLRRSGCAAQLVLIDDDTGVLHAVAALGDPATQLVQFRSHHGFLPERHGRFARVGCLADCLRVLGLT